jgi:DNA-binding NarL/FixJ family response regulator
MSNPIYRLLLIDPDPVFRLGLRAWLDPLPDLGIAAETDTAEQALQILAGTAALESPKKLIPRKPALKIDLAVLGFNIGQGSLNPALGLELCQQLKSQYPALPILVLGFPQDTTELSPALKGSIDGYCLKGQSPEELVTAIRQVASGQTYWSDLNQNRNGLLPNQSSALSDRPVGVWSIVKQNLYWSGVRQIDAALCDLTAEQENFSSSTADLIAKAILAGRMRELSAARWLVNRMWQPEATRSQESGRSIPGFRIDDFPSGRSLQLLSNSDNRDRLRVNPKAIELSLFDTTVAKLQETLTNLTSTPLEIDILRDVQKRELLYIVLRQIENSLSELRFAQTQLHQISEKRSVILRDVWQLSLTEFFGKYYTLTDQKKGTIGVVDVLLQDADGVAATILNKIPQVAELLSHLLFQTPLIIDNQTYEVGTPEAMYRAEMLLDNLLIQIANAVMQPLLNHFADVEGVKQKFYTYNLIASRDIERFRNDLSWKYRLEQYVAEPQAIFESRFILWGLVGSGIAKNPIYAPRTQELQQLQGIRLAVTLALELQDAIAPRLRSAVSFLGSGVVYVLTNVVGRGIGLIGRGVLQGIGSAWDENRFRPKGRSQ